MNTSIRRLKSGRRGLQNKIFRIQYPWPRCNKVSTMSGSLAKTFGRLCVFWKAIFLVVLPLGLLPLVFNPQETDSEDKLKSKCAYVGLLMAFSWMLELLPLPVTSLIPVALFPLFGVMSTKEVSMEYLNKTCMLFVGGKEFNFSSFSSFLQRQESSSSLRGFKLQFRK